MNYALKGENDDAYFHIFNSNADNLWLPASAFD